MTQKRINYLNNKDLLSEIHKSKLSYCEFSEDNCEYFDYIVDLPRAASKGKKVKVPHPHSEEYKIATDKRRSQCLDEQTVIDARAKRANRLSLLAYNQAVKEATATYDAAIAACGRSDDVSKIQQKKVVKSEYAIDPETIPLSDLVIRFHTYEHIPLNEDHKPNADTDQEYHMKVNFTPFIHYKYVIKGKKVTGIREVGRSHSEDGEYSNIHGTITSKLAHMFVLLTDKYAQKHNWRGYTYVDDMKGHALLQLSDVGLHFNEARSENPFAYLTTTLKNAFLRVLQKEKKQQDIRDDLIEQAGQSPSNTRQTSHEERIRVERNRLMDKN